MPEILDWTLEPIGDPEQPLPPPPPEKPSAAAAWWGRWLGLAALIALIVAGFYGWQWVMQVATQQALVEFITREEQAGRNQAAMAAFVDPSDADWAALQAELS